jgi:hypothetical protein
VMGTGTRLGQAQAPEKRNANLFFRSLAKTRTEARFGLAKAQQQATKQDQGLV